MRAKQDVRGPDVAVCSSRRVESIKGAPDGGGDPFGLARQERSAGEALGERDAGYERHHLIRDTVARSGLEHRHETGDPSILWVGRLRRSSELQGNSRPVGPSREPDLMVSSGVKATLKNVGSDLLHTYRMVARSPLTAFARLARHGRPAGRPRWGPMCRRRSGAEWSSQRSTPSGSGPRRTTAARLRRAA